MIGLGIKLRGLFLSGAAAIGIIRRLEDNTTRLLEDGTIRRLEV